jgi:chitodextrinase
MIHPLKFKRNIRLQPRSRWIMFIVTSGVMSLMGLLNATGLANATCANIPDSSKGTDTLSINVTTAGTYSVWSRVLTADTTNNSFYLQVDGGCAIDVGNSSSIPAGAWTWVNYQDGNTGTKTSLSLTTGAHQVVLTGKQPNVGVDRILLLSDPNCVPTGTGDNCVTTTTAAPTVNITGPAIGATVSGTTGITANASETGGSIANVQYKLDGNNLGAALTVSPYTYGWNTAGTTNGSHTLTAIATDAAGVTATSSAVTVTVNNSTSTTDTTAPSAPSNLRTTSTGTNSAALAWGASTDNVGVTGYHVWRGDANYSNWIQIATVSASTLNFTDNSLSSGTSYTYGVRAFDAAGNVSASSNTIKVVTNAGDTTAPTVNVTAPAAGATVSGTTVISANASDNVGVKNVQFKLDGTLLGSQLTTAPYGVSWDTTKVANGSHTLTAIAADAAGNTASSSVTVTVNNQIIDTSPPTQPAGLTATAVSSSQINLAWGASTDNVGVTGYQIYRSTVGTAAGLIATVNTTSYGDAALSANYSYNYYIVALDAAGNKSVASATVSATTQTPPTTATVQGVVSDSRTLAPISGAQVQTGKYATSTGIETTSTNSSGQYVLTNIKTGSKHSYSFSATNYRSKSYTLQFPVGINTLNVPLVHK